MSNFEAAPSGPQQRWTLIAAAARELLKPLGVRGDAKSNVVQAEAAKLIMEAEAQQAIGDADPRIIQDYLDTLPDPDSKMDFIRPFAPDYGANGDMPILPGAEPPTWDASGATEYAIAERGFRYGPPHIPNQ